MGPSLLVSDVVAKRLLGGFFSRGGRGGFGGGRTSSRSGGLGGLLLGAADHADSQRQPEQQQSKALHTNELLFVSSL